MENGKQRTWSLGCFATAEEAALMFARLAPGVKSARKAVVEGNVEGSAPAAAAADTAVVTTVVTVDTTHTAAAELLAGIAPTVHEHTFATSNGMTVSVADDGGAPASLDADGQTVEIRCSVALPPASITRSDAESHDAGGATTSEGESGGGGTAAPAALVAVGSDGVEGEPAVVELQLAPAL